jgi:hypothetical protein
VVGMMVADIHAKLIPRAIEPITPAESGELPSRSTPPPKKPQH